VSVTVLLYNDPLFCGFNVPIKGLTESATRPTAVMWEYIIWLL